MRERKSTMLKKMISIFMIFFIVVQFNMFPVISVYASQGTHIEEKMNQITAGATEFVNENLDIMKTLVKECAEDLGIDKKELENTELGKPFLVYKIDQSNQDELFFYPVINKNTDTVLYIVNIVGTTVGWQYSINTDFVDELNDIDWSNKNDYIFYESDDKIMAQSLSEEYPFSDNNIVNDFIDEKLIKKDRYSYPEIQHL